MPNLPIRMCASVLALSLAPTCLVALAQSKPPIAPQRPVVDTYFGTEVIDPYRWMETGGAELQDYMTAQNAVTQETLAPFAAQNAALLERLKSLAQSVPAVAAPQRMLDDYYYLQIPTEGRDFLLMTRPVKGGAERLLFNPQTFAQSGKHAAIDFFDASWDGKYVIVGVSLGGSENSTLRIIETATGALLPESIDRTQDAEASWDEDSQGFHYARLQMRADGAAASTKYENMRVYHHRLGDDPELDQAVWGPDVAAEPVLPKTGHVAIEHLRGTQLLLALQASGVIETPALWRHTTQPDSWQQIVRHEDGVLHIASHGTWLYVISKAGAANGQVLGFDAATATFASAKVILAASDLVLSSRNGAGLTAAADALYVLGARNGISVVTRIPYDDPSKMSELPLPVAGSARGLAADDRRPGITIGLNGWTVAPLQFAYDPVAGTFRDTGLQLPNPADFSAITSVEVEATSDDGTLVPLSIVYRKDLKRDGTNPTLLEAYGAYGVSISPFFTTTLLPWLERGGIFAVAHVRGGGEKGEAWHLAGMKQTKQHTIDDFVACARYLVAEHYTTSAHLGIQGTSAGGIAVGGFLTQHPELVSAVLYRVGITDLLRSEQRATGSANSAEYGSVKVEPEFRAMYAINPYSRVRDGAAYPAVMLETGANDPRVTSWMLTKMTARLQAANRSSNPILLRVDFDAGHGIGSDREQALRLRADEYTFLGWQLGMQPFAPVTAKP